MTRILLVLLILPLVAPPAFAAPEPTVGIPHEGDRFAYRVSGVTTTLLWNGTMDFWDEWGRPMKLDLLEAHGAEGDVVRVGYRGGELVPRTWEGQGGRSSGGGGSSGDAAIWGDNRSTQTATHGAIWYTSSEPAGRPCLERAGWQGRTFAQVAASRPADLCPLFRGDAIRQEGNETVHGYAARRFLVEDHDMLSGAFWLAADLPYPLAWSDCNARGGTDDLCGDAANATVQLVGFAPGEGSLLPDAGPMPQGGADASALADLDGPTPDHGASPFPPSVALAAIANDTSLSAHRDFLSAHPNAPIVEATHAHDPRVNDSTAESWTFVWAAPDGSASMVTSQQDGSCTVPDLGPAVPVPRSAMMCKPAQREGRASLAQGTFPASLPTRAMTFAAAISRFQSERLNPDEPLWTETYAVSRGPGGEEATIRVDAALVGSTAQPNSPLQQPASPGMVNGDGIVFDALTGRATMRQFVSSVQVTWTRTPGLVPPLVGPGVLGPAAAPSAPLATLRAAGPVATPTFEAQSTAVATIAVAGGSIVLLLLALRGSLAVLYARIRRRDVPSHPRRAAILRAVDASPGLSLAEVSDATGVRGGAIRHHLAVLVRAGHLARVDVAGQARYFRAGAHAPAHLAEQAVLLADGAEARALRALREKPGVHAGQLAEALGVSRPSVHGTIRKLAKRGLVETRRDGMRTRLYPR